MEEMGEYIGYSEALNLLYLKSGVNGQIRNRLGQITMGLYLKLGELGFVLGKQQVMKGFEQRHDLIRMF